MHATAKVRLTVALSTNMSRAVDYLTEEQAAAALQFMDDPNRIPLPPSALDVMTTLLIDRWGTEEHEREIGAPARSARPLLAQALDTYTALDTWTLIRGRQPKPAPDPLPVEVEDLRAHIKYLTADTDSAAEVAEVQQGYCLSARDARLLVILRRARGATVAYEDVLARLCYDSAPEDIPDVRVISSAVCRVRKKLAAANAKWRIEAVRGVGYRLVDGVELRSIEGDAVAAVR